MTLLVNRNIRVLVEDVPELVRGLLSHALSGQPDIELVNGRVVPLLRDAAAPDVVVATQRGDDLESVRRLLSKWPQTKVLMISVDGRQAALFQLEPHRTQLRELSPTELAATIRAAGRH
jgi:DNA-binding NarL/FixJ family response regulator